MKTISRFDSLLPRPAFIGMVHLEPLPGAPRWNGSIQRVLDAALRDAEALEGVHGIIVENYNDAPFFPDNVPPETIAAMSVVIAEIVRNTKVPVGVNVLRNDAHAALAIAAAAHARFIRVNVHTGTMFTDQGPITGRAHETIRLREHLCPDVAVAADVFVKHATPPAGASIADAAADAWHRGQADALIVSGVATGAATRPEDVQAVRAALPDARIWIGSGLTLENATTLVPVVDAAIVGTALTRDGAVGSGVDPQKVQSMLQAFQPR